MGDLRWRETSEEVYWAIYGHHRDELRAFASCTDPDGSQFGSPYVMTEWGFGGADYPLIRIEDRGNGRMVYIAQPEAEDE